MYFMQIALENGVLLREIPSLPNKDYMAGTDGHIYSRTRYAGFGRKEYMDWYPLKEHQGKTGYHSISACHQNKKKTLYVHSLICEAFHGKRPDYAQVRHMDGNPSNNAPWNLKWGTAQENWNDKRRHHTATVGEKHPMSKLTDGQRAEILRLSLQGKSPRKRANVYSVGQTAIWKILKSHSA